MLAEGSERPFEAHIVMLNILVHHESVVLLINRVVCQVHVLIALGGLCAVGLWCKSRETLFVDINAQRLVARDANVQSQVKFMTVDQERIWNIPRNHTLLLHIDIVDLINDFDAFALTAIHRLDNPSVALWLCLLQLAEMRDKLWVFSRQNISVGNEVIFLVSEALLGLHIIVAKAVFARYFNRHWEVVDALELVHLLEQSELLRRIHKENVPLSPIRKLEIIRLKNLVQQSACAILWDFVLHAVVISGEHLAALSSVRARLRIVVHQHLDFVDGVNLLQLVNTLQGLLVVVLVNVDLALLPLLLLPVHVELSARCLVWPGS
jgi:hypothetical protein